MTETESKLSAIATHLYVRLRRDGGRVIDVIWMVHNREYAAEVLRIARAMPDDEVSRLADRYEEIMFGLTPRVQERGASAIRSGNNDAPAPAPAPEPTLNASVVGRYRGHLR